MDDLAKKIEALGSEVNALLSDPGKAQEWVMPGSSYFLPNGEVVALPRDSGDSRYPYGPGGFNFWVYASGYMHGNEGLFSTFLKASHGQEPNIAFFAGIPQGEGSYKPIPLLPVPCMGKDECDSIRHYTVLGTEAAYFITELPELRFGLRVFVTENKTLCFSLHVLNRTETRQNLYVSAYLNPFLRNQIHSTDEDNWFKEIKPLDAPTGEGQPGSFLLTVHEDKDRHHTITYTGLLRQSLVLDDNSRLERYETTPSRHQYVGGVRGSLHTAAALRSGTFGKQQPICTFTEAAIMGDLLYLDLAPGGEARRDLLFSWDHGRTEGLALLQKPVDPTWMDSELKTLIQKNTEKHANLSIEVAETRDDRLKPNIFNAFFEYLKRQVEFCSVIKGYVQLSPNSLIGIRDVFQALEGFLFWQPDAARAKMIEALNFTAPDGRCFRQYSLPSANGAVGRMDLRPFIDQGVWIISTVWTYLCVTGDWKFLDQECGYHKIIDEDSLHVEPTRERDSVLEHLFKIMNYLLDNCDHAKTRCVLALYGDWNDALDGLGISADPKKEYGSGVSVMATLQVYQNTQEMIGLLESLDAKKYAEKIERYRQAAQEIEQGLQRYAIVEGDDGTKRILHGWGDNYAYQVGGFNDPDGQPRDGITSNAFWIISGLIQKHPGLRDTILDAFDRLDSKYGYKTFEPAFPEDTKGVGRITKLPPGTAENGATYIHATLFGIMALFLLGKAREAWEQLVKILPFTPLHKNLSHSPFVMPNSYGYNPDKWIDGQNMNDWQTGSSNVVLKILIRFVFGYEPELNGVWIQPALWSPFKVFKFQLYVRGCRIRIDYRDEQVGTRSFTVNEKERDGVDDPSKGIQKLWIDYKEFRQGEVLDIRVVD